MAEIHLIIETFKFDQIVYLLSHIMYLLSHIIKVWLVLRLQRHFLVSLYSRDHQHLLFTFAIVVVPGKALVCSFILK